MNKRVAIFQYDFVIQSHTFNLIDAFLSKGYFVDFFYFAEPTELKMVLFDKYDHEKKIYRKNYESYKSRAWRIYGKFLRKMFNVKHSSDARQHIILFAIIDSFLKVKKKKDKYKFLIGVEKKGLIWAGEIGKMLNIPYFYYSLELYNKFHPVFASGYNDLFKGEVSALKDARGIIIPDSDRASILKRDTGQVKKCVYLPVSFNGSKVSEKSTFLQNKFNIKNPVLLNIGIHSKGRKADELVDLWKKNETDMVLVFHGFIDEYVKNISEGIKNLILSEEFVPTEQQYKIVSSAYIGLAIYDNLIENDRLTAFSSAKIALYCQSGIPFVAIENENYLKLKNKYDCCGLIKDIKDLFFGIKEITENYDFYRKNAFKAYDNIYDFNRHKSRVVDEIEQISRTD